MMMMPLPSAGEETLHDLSNKDIRARREFLLNFIPLAPTRHVCRAWPGRKRSSHFWWWRGTRRRKAAKPGQHEASWQVRSFTCSLPTTSYIVKRCALYWKVFRMFVQVVVVATRSIWLYFNCPSSRDREEKSPWSQDQRIGKESCGEATFFGSAKALLSNDTPRTEWITLITKSYFDVNCHYCSL